MTQIFCPASLPEALELFSSQDLRILAGGTDLMVERELSKHTSPHGTEKDLVSLLGISELTGVIDKGNSLTIGACVSFSEIKNHPLLKAQFPLLCQAAATVGAVGIQNRATLGGNIANASPAGDSLPALLVYKAQLEIASRNSKRILPYAQFHQGYKKTALGPGEVISALLLPRPATETLVHHVFRKVGTRAAQAISKVSFAGVLHLDASQRVTCLKIALGSVGPFPVLLTELESLMDGQILSVELIQDAVNQLSKWISPLDDIRSTAAYRLKVCQNLLEDFLTTATQQRSHATLDHPSPRA